MGKRSRKKAKEQGQKAPRSQRRSNRGKPEERPLPKVVADVAGLTRADADALFAAWEGLPEYEPILDDQTIDEETAADIVLTLERAWLDDFRSAVDSEDEDRARLGALAWAAHWTVVGGFPPTPEEAEARLGAERIAELFEDTDGFLAAAGVKETSIFDFADDVRALLVEAEDKLAAAQETETRVGRERRVLERDQKSVADLKRQAETARAKRKEAERARDEARAAEQQASREAAALARRLDALAPAEGQAVEDGKVSSEEVTRLEERLARVEQELEAEVASHGATRDERDLAHEMADKLESARVAQDQVAARLRAEIIALRKGTERREEEPPDSVLEAVKRARRDAEHLQFAQRALDTADESPFRRPADILEALMRLDALAGEYVSGSGGRSLRDAAQELGLDWRASVSQTALNMARSDYEFPHAGRKWTMGEHVVVGNGSGAGLCARIYLSFHPGDGDHDRRVMVGHVGRHLRDTTT